ncbi:hypothetical protein J7438_02440 [Thalassotalea sp. G20_0]|nr:hypothetical protein [Thalassotalea sp. G20_0]MBO9492951.1 hypothetical protein [Thalassotalea sp. G20_0]
MNRSDLQALARDLPEAREELNRLAQLMDQQRNARIAVFIRQVQLRAPC